MMDLNLVEDIRTEFKDGRGGVPKSLYETYSSFANTCGGVIYIGVVEKNGKIVETPGVLNPREYIKDIVNTLNNPSKVSENIVGDNSFRIIDEKEDGTGIIAIYVNEASRGEKPIYLNGQISNAYKRNNEGDYKVSNTELLSMINDNMTDSKDFDLNASGFSFEDINKESFQMFRNIFNQNAPDNIYKTYSDFEFAKKVGIIRKNDNGAYLLTNASVLFFTDNISILTIYPNYFVDYQENVTSKSRWDIRIVSDELNWSGNLFDFFIKVCLRLVNDRINTFELNNIVNVSGNLLDQALREALVNCIANADFISSNGILIKKAYDRIVFANSGKPLIAIDQMICGGSSNPRNKEIIRLFRILGFSERSGYGVPNIFDVFAKLKFPTPIIEEENNPDRTIVNLLVIPNINDTSSKLSSRELVSYIASFENGISQVELINHFGVDRKTLLNVLNALISNGTIKTNEKKAKGKLYFL